MPLNPKEKLKLERNRRRGWILYLLYESLPKPLEFSSLIFLLDKYNYPLTPRRLSEDLDFLRGLGLLRVFPLCSETELDSVRQSKLLQSYASSDGENNDEYCCILTTKGTHFQEGDSEYPGVMRIN